MPVDAPTSAPAPDPESPAVTTTAGGGPDPGPDPVGDPAPRRGSPIGRVVVVAVVVGLVAMWGYVVYLAFGPGREPPVDRLDDPAFARAAEARCAAAVDQVDQLPLATETPTPRARAGVLDQANGTFATMLDDLEGMVELAPAGGQRERVWLWLDDWRTYLDNRLEYADRLRNDHRDARLEISEKAGTGRHITGWIDEFALANRMPSCATPTDA